MTIPKPYFVYILASRPGGTLYIGITSDLIRRVKQHREGTASAFTRKYKVLDLVYYEIFADAQTAITREKRLKNWNRDWKIDLIVSVNPDWRDLYEKMAADHMIK